MKIVIVSPCNIANYGAILQGWALRTVLERMGHEVYHLNVPWLWHGIRNWKRLLASRRISTFISKIRVNGMMRKAFALMGDVPFTKEYNSLKNLKRNPPDADIYIVGSDQVWHEEKFEDFSKADVVTLNFGRESIVRLSYAASFGNAQWGDVSINRAKDYSSPISRFKAISVREKSACEMVEKVWGKTSVWVPDPTLLLNNYDYLSLINENESLAGRERHIFTYLLGFDNNHNYDHDMIEGIVKVLKRHNDHLSEVRNVRVPTDLKTWLSRLIASNCVVTNSFHGLCFSLLFHRPFIMVGFKGEDEWRNERVLSLLSYLNLTDRMIVDFNEERVNQIVDRPLDWDNIDQKIKEFRKKGMDFLTKNMRMS